MAIVFVRCDNRLIHGQIVTRWSSFISFKGIIVVDDETSKNEFQVKILKNATPESIKVGVFDEQIGAEKINKAKIVETKYLLMVKSPVTLLRLMKNGADFGKNINIGNMSARPDAENVAPHVSLIDKELIALNEL